MAISRVARRPKERRYRYSVFGLTVESDLEVPGLRESRDGGPPDLRLDLRGRPWPRRDWPREPTFQSPFLNARGRPQLRVWRSAERAWYRFLYDDGAEFLVAGSADRVLGRWPESLTIDDVGPYLVGPILGFVLRLRGVVCLHASAVVLDGQAVAFVGAAGAGKSTIAAAFAGRGRPVVSDDVVALAPDGDRFEVHPAYPWLRLWAASVEALFGSPDALPRIAPADPSWPKRYLELDRDGDAFAATARPLGAIYLLKPRGSEEGAPLVRADPEGRLLLGLVANSYGNYLLDRGQRTTEFELLGCLVRRVRTRVLVPGASHEELAALCELVEADFARSAREAEADG